MTNEELLQAMEQMMDKKLQPIKEDMEAMKEDMEIMKEDLSEVRAGVNTLLDWAEKVGDSIQFPLPKIAQ